MKRYISVFVILAALLACFGAQAEGSAVPALDEQLFADAKAALVYFEAGDYDSAAQILQFADAEELGRFIEGNYLTLGAGVQTEVSVAWWNGSAWNLGVPLYEPADPFVESLVLTTHEDDGAAFCGYMYAMWSEIEAWIAECDYVVWNQEYTDDASFVIYEDD